jgi:hypothetical protein
MITKIDELKQLCGQVGATEVGQICTHLTSCYILHAIFSFFPFRYECVCEEFEPRALTKQAGLTDSDYLNIRI